MRKNYHFTGIEYDRIKIDLETLIDIGENEKEADVEVMSEISKKIYREFTNDKNYE